MKLKNAQYIKELHCEYEHVFFKISIFGVFIAIYSKKACFLLPTFGSSTNRRRKLMTYLKSWRNSESSMLFLCKNMDSKIWPFDLILTWPKSKVNFGGVIGHHYRFPHVKWPTNMCRTAYLWLLFSGDLLWPDLDLDISRYDLCTHAVFFSDIYQHFLWVWALCCPPNRVYSHKYENSVFFSFWHSVDLIRAIYLKMLNMD